ncbi:hypothetical protein MANES_17G089020v8 [Manihot esculenta]|uniref:Uncharacterized protein n=1 Tax=Manihot esculenta TaxID=3983 RepID=A0ACB7G507_MANES|nr:hypothetical protein MANES_17G089020v8 [Manihot esculenta]
MEDAKHPRLILHEFLSLDECKELEFIHKSSSTSQRLLHHSLSSHRYELSHFIIPFVPIREKVEEFFGC